TGTGDDRGPASLSVYRGLGDGTFSPPELYGTLPPLHGYFELVATDVNADGHLDIVASTALSNFYAPVPAPYFENGVAVFLNQGAGTFGSPTFYDHSGQTIGGIAVADFNGDGLTDILVANLDDDSFSILFAAEVAAALRAFPLPEGAATGRASS